MAAKGLSVQEYLRAALPSAGAAGGGLTGQGTELAAVAEKQAARQLRRAVADALAALAAAHALGSADDDGSGGSGSGSGAPREAVLAFVLQEGLVDPCPLVRDAMLVAGSALVDAYAPHAAHAARLLHLLEAHMDSAERDAAAVAAAAAATAAAKADKATGAAGAVGKGGSKGGKDGKGSPAGAAAEDPVVLGDRRREGTVALLGSVAKHLDKADPKVRLLAFGL
jgi:hypothetical protein